MGKKKNFFKDNKSLLTGLGVGAFVILLGSALLFSNDSTNFQGKLDLSEVKCENQRGGYGAYTLCRDNSLQVSANKMEISVREVNEEEIILSLTNTEDDRKYEKVSLKPRGTLEVKSAIGDYLRIDLGDFVSKEFINLKISNPCTDSSSDGSFAEFKVCEGSKIVNKGAEIEVINYGLVNGGLNIGVQKLGNTSETGEYKINLEKGDTQAIKIPNYGEAGVSITYLGSEGTKDIVTLSAFNCPHNVQSGFGGTGVDIEGCVNSNFKNVDTSLEGTITRIRDNEITMQLKGLYDDPNQFDIVTLAKNEIYTYGRESDSFSEGSSLKYLAKVPNGKAQIAIENVSCEKESIEIAPGVKEHYLCTNKSVNTSQFDAVKLVKADSNSIVLEGNFANQSTPVEFELTFGESYEHQETGESSYKYTNRGMFGDGRMIVREEIIETGCENYEWDGSTNQFNLCLGANQVRDPNNNVNYRINTINNNFAEISIEKVNGTETVSIPVGGSFATIMGEGGVSIQYIGNTTNQLGHGMFGFSEIDCSNPSNTGNGTVELCRFSQYSNDASGLIVNLFDPARNQFDIKRLNSSGLEQGVGRISLEKNYPVAIGDTNNSENNGLTVKLKNTLANGKVELEVNSVDCSLNNSNIGGVEQGANVCLNKLITSTANNNQLILKEAYSGKIIVQLGNSTPKEIPLDQQRYTSLNDGGTQINIKYLGLDSFGKAIVQYNQNAI